MPPLDLTPLLAPESVAVVGASGRPGSLGARTIENLEMGGFGGAIHLVNPKRDTIGRHRCHPSLGTIGKPVDCALLVVPGEQVVAVAEDAAQLGVRSVVVLAAGFKESGDATGAEAEARLCALARETGLPILGPNCLGLVNFGRRTALTFAPGLGQITAKMDGGPGIALISQSGALGSYLLHAYLRGVNFSHFVSTGNSSVIDVGDCVLHLANEPDVRSICLLYEGLRADSALPSALDVAHHRGLPVVAVKAGRTEAGASAAASHTGAAVSDHRACIAALEARGVMVVPEPAVALEAAAFLAKVRGRTPRAGGVAIVSGSGGACVLACDTAERHAVPLAEFAEATVNAISGEVPGFGNVANPVDLTGRAITSDSMTTVLERVAEDPAVGAIVVPLGIAIHDELAAARPRSLVASAARTETPYAVVWMSEWSGEDAVAILERSQNTGLFRTLDSCLAAVGHWLRSTVAAVSPPVAAPRDWAALSDQLPPSGTLDEGHSRALLRPLGIPFVPSLEIAGTDPEAVAAAVAEWSHYPAVLKIVSPDLPHKAAAGGVRVNLSDAAETAAAARGIVEAVTASAPTARLTGFLLQPMIRASVELLVGGVRDQVYGPMVAIGPGGAGAGADSPARVAAAPLDTAQARALLRSTPGVSHLDDRITDSLAEVLVALGDTLVGLDRLSAVELNPVLVGPDGVVAVDALAVVGP